MTVGGQRGEQRRKKEGKKGKWRRESLDLKLSERDREEGTGRTEEVRWNQRKEKMEEIMKAAKNKRIYTVDEEQKH